MEDSAPVIMGSSTDNTLTINAEKDQTASVTLSGVNIDVSGAGKAAVSTTGAGNVSIELNGESKLKSGEKHAGLEKNNGGRLTIAGEDKNGKLTAEGGDWGAGIDGGVGGDGSDITVSGDAKLKVQGGVEDDVDGVGAGIGDGGSNADGSQIPGAEVEPDTSGLLTTGWIEYYAPGADMEKDKPTSTTFGTSSQPEKPIERGADAPLYRVTDRDGRDIAYTAEQTGGVLTVTVDADFAVLTGRLSGIRTLKAQGVEKLVFVTKGATSAFLLSDLLGKGESGEAYWLTHDGRPSRSRSAKTWRPFSPSRKRNLRSHAGGQAQAVFARLVCQKRDGRRSGERAFILTAFRYASISLVFSALWAWIRDALPRRF